MVRYRSLFFSCIAVSAALYFFALSVPLAQAQFSGLPNTENSLRIALDPADPQPGDVVHLSVQSSFIDTSAGDIAWSINGKLQTHGVGQDSTTVIAGPLGSETDVTVSVTDGSLSASARAAIIPTQ